MVLMREKKGGETDRNVKERGEGRREQRDPGVLFCDKLYPPNSKAQYLSDPSLRRVFAWVRQGDP